jgi:hypothetical protein
MSRYLELTRSPTYSLLFAFPLLLLYEAGAVYIAQGNGAALRNGADVLLRTLLALGGVEGTLALTAMVAAGSLILIILDRRRVRRPLHVRHFAGMTMESAVYALLLGLVVGSATHWLLETLSLSSGSGSFASLSLTEGLVLSLGAGLYEELVFRVLLVGGIFAVLRGSGLSKGQSGFLSVVAASLLFSAFHYIGPYGDVWALPSFLFRFLAGVAFSVLFLARGFGITAWTHALYDVFIVVALAR